jgi:cytochrome P450
MTSVTHQIIPGPRGLEKFLTHLKLKLDHLTAIRELHQFYGEIVTPGEALYYVNSPQLAHEILMNTEVFVKDPISGYADTTDLFWGNAMQVSNDASWQHKRRIIQRGTSRERIPHFAEVVVAYTQHMIAGWKEGASFDLHAALMRLTLQITIRNIMGVELPAEDFEAVEQAMLSTLDLFNEPGEVPYNADHPQRRAFDVALDRMNGIVEQVVRSRRTENSDRGDLLFILLPHLTDKEARDEIVTFLRAGHRNTAALLAWCFYALTQHPQIESQLHAEIDTVLGSVPATIDTLAALPYAESVVYEAMRLYPLYPLIVRTACQNVQIGAYDIPEKARLVISVMDMHCNPDLFPDPDRFTPQRWQKAINLPGYFPFGDGPRQCPFKSYGEMESVLLLVTIAQSFMFQLTEPQKVKVNFTKNGLLPKDGISVRAIRRAK